MADQIVPLYTRGTTVPQTIDETGAVADNAALVEITLPVGSNDIALTIPKASTSWANGVRQLLIFVAHDDGTGGATATFSTADLITGPSESKLTAVGDYWFLQNAFGLGWLLVKEVATA